jgi:hypothetical protein
LALLAIAAALVLVTAAQIFMAARPVEVKPVTSVLPTAIEKPPVLLLPQDELSVAFAARVASTRERVSAVPQTNLALTANLAAGARFTNRASGLRARLAERRRTWRTDAM